MDEKRIIVVITLGTREEERSVFKIFDGSCRLETVMKHCKLELHDNQQLKAVRLIEEDYRDPASN